MNMRNPTIQRVPPRDAPRRGRFGAPRAGGLTLVELMLAVAITAIIGLGVASMLFAFTYGSSVQADDREAMVAAELVKIRMSETVQRSCKVLAKGSNYLVLWVTDANGNNQPELSELRRIEYDSTAKTLTSYKPPSTLSPDTTYNLATTDFNAVTSALKGTSSLPGQLWSSISSFAIVLDNVTVQAAKFVGWQITVTSRASSENAVGGAMLRNS
jgi:type II secretory pathway pseudopilin PulG